MKPQTLALLRAVAGEDRGCLVLDRMHSSVDCHVLCGLDQPSDLSGPHWDEITANKGRGNTLAVPGVQQPHKASVARGALVIIRAEGSSRSDALKLTV